MGNTLNSRVDFGNFPKRVRISLLQREGPSSGSEPAEGRFGGKERSGGPRLEPDRTVEQVRPGHGQDRPADGGVEQVGELFGLRARKRHCDWVSLIFILHYEYSVLKIK